VANRSQRCEAIRRDVDFIARVLQRRCGDDERVGIIVHNEHSAAGLLRI
jgi:hypothetical protein